MNNFTTNQNFQDCRKILKDNKMVFKDKGHNHFWIQIRESPCPQGRLATSLRCLLRR